MTGWANIILNKSCLNSGSITPIPPINDFCLAPAYLFDDFCLAPAYLFDLYAGARQKGKELNDYDCVSLLEGSRTSDLREFSKFRYFSENRSVLFPSALATRLQKEVLVAEISCNLADRVWCLEFQSQKGILL